MWMLRRKDGPEKELLNQPPVNSPEKKIKITKYEKANESVEEKIILRTIAAPKAPSSTTAIDEKKYISQLHQSEPKKRCRKINIPNYSYSILILHSQSESDVVVEAASSH